MAAAFSDTVSSTRRLLSSVQVTVRAKPTRCSSDDTRNSSRSPANGDASIISRVADDNSSRSNMLNFGDKSFTFDHVVWTDGSQEQIYKAAAHPFVEKSLQGYDATILAYGAAQTGKSYIMGTLVPMMNNCLSSGLIQRCLKHIFGQDKIGVSASIVEIFNEELYDLLNGGAKVTTSDEAASDPRIERMWSFGNGFQMVKKALQLRQDKVTFGSRSHVLVKLHLKIQDGEKCLESKLNLIDLTGSTVKKSTGAKGQSFGERCCFEESISALTRIMAKETTSLKNALNANSILTSILKDSLDAKCLISLVACVSLRTDDRKEDLRTLLFAKVARTVKIEPKLRATSVNNESGFNSIIDKRASVSKPKLTQTEAIVMKRHSNTADKLLTKFNMKNCIVVLNQSEVDFYGHDKNLKKYEENADPENYNGTEEIHQKLPLASKGATSPPATSSTVSISRLETPNPNVDTFRRTDIDERTMRSYFDDSFSISSLEDNNSEKNHIGNKKTSEEFEFYLTCSCACQCSLSDSQRATKWEQVLEPLTDKAEKENIQSILADNVSQLSICTGEETEIPECQNEEAEDRPRLASVASNESQSLEQLEPFRGFGVINHMKRSSAPQRVDFSGPGPSGITRCPTPRKIPKLEENNSLPKVNGVQGSCEPDIIDFEKDKGCCNNTENVEKELTEKQKAQNAYILGILNSCDVKQLQILPRIGAKTAMSIYHYRSIHGEFKSLKDLKNLPIWTQKFFIRFLTANNVVLE